MCKVSVIVPIYNVERYLEKCLDSLINQTLSDIEIICVNDGSLDNSLAVIEKYAKKDNRIEVINQENQGQGVARNNAIKVAKGEFLGFVDPDDWAELNMFEKMYNSAIKNNVDTVICNSRTHYEVNGKLVNETREFILHDHLKEQGVTIEPSEILVYEKVKPVVLYGIPNTSWRYLVKTDFIRKNNIVFDEGKIFEDSAFWIPVKILSKMIYIEDVLYNYLYRKTSALRTYKGELKTLYNQLRTILTRFGLFEELKEQFDASLYKKCSKGYVVKDNLNDYLLECEKYLSQESYNLIKDFEMRQKSKRFRESIFSIKNTHDNGMKQKMITVLGMKWRI